ncbi:MAG: TRAP transporter small permease [Rhodobacteraceae bacterium]|nr:TRAP transporter small permease [Paracoccaceae bacterium]
MIDRVESIILSLLLGLMVLVTFVNVVLRYAFNSAILWGQELTLVLFAWLVIFGASHCMKSGMHLGVDILVARTSQLRRRRIGMIAGLACMLYCLLLLKGSWDYWAPFAGLSETTGRWFPSGFNPATMDLAWYETDQLPFPAFMRVLEILINQGESYDKLPRVVPYAILPVGAALLMLRVTGAVLRLWRGEQGMLISGQDIETASTPESRG